MKSTEIREQQKRDMGISNESDLSDIARMKLRQSGYNVQAIEDAWESGDYGYLCIYQTGAVVRRATREEALRSLESDNDSGAVLIDCRNDDDLQRYADGESYATCFVLP